jgi:peptide/nickel transport system permease protein
VTTLAEISPYLADSGARGVVRRLRANPLTLVGGAVVLVVLLAAALGPALAPYDPSEGDLLARNQGFSREHPLGTDFLGRDLLSRILHGARTSVAAALVLMAVIVTVSVAIGTLAGYFPGVVDSLLMRVTDVVLAFPTLILALAIAGFLGPGLGNALLALGLVWWAGFARIIRGQVIAVRSRAFIEAAEAAAGTHASIIRRHIIPNVASTVIVLATLDVGVIVLALAGLSFLGLGVQPPTPEWGRMLFDAKPYLERAPLQMLVPGAAIALTVLGFNLLGDGLRDAFDPHGVRL